MTRSRSVALAGFALVAVGVGPLQMAQRIAMRPDISAPPVIAPLRLVNAYGVFAHISRDRREMVIEAWKETANNQVQAAKILGITRATLRKRIEKFGPK